MNSRILRQCKKSLAYGKKVERDIKLSLSDRCQLRTLTKRMRKDGNIDSISFEEYVLLCKKMKIDSKLIIRTNYSTKINSVLNFNSYTLKQILYQCVNDIIENKDEMYYPKVDFDNVVHMLELSNIILFESFMSYCTSLKIKVEVE